MKFSTLLLPPLILMSLHASCGGKSDSKKSIPSPETQKTIATEKPANPSAIDELQKKVNELQAALDRSNVLDGKQKVAAERKFKVLQMQRIEINSSLRDTADRNFELRLKLEAAAKSAAIKQLAMSRVVKFPACGPSFYGDVSICNDKKCGKSDPALQINCEIGTDSRPAEPLKTTGASGFIFCGSQFYGDTFVCNGSVCGKSDAQLENICEITVESQPMTPNHRSLGESGYPYCGSEGFGYHFGCGNRSCAKSDSEYINICELN